MSEVPLDTSKTYQSEMEFLIKLFDPLKNITPIESNLKNQRGFRDNSNNLPSKTFV